MLPDSGLWLRDLFSTYGAQEIIVPLNFQNLAYSELLTNASHLMERQDSVGLRLALVADCWLWFPAPPLIPCVTLGQLLTLSVLQHPHLQNGASHPLFRGVL